MVDQDAKNEDQEFGDIVKRMHDKDESIHATQKVRKISQQKNPPIKMLIDHGVVPICVRFLESKM